MTLNLSCVLILEIGNARLVVPGPHPDATACLRVCDPSDCAFQSLLSITPNLPCVLLLEIGNAPSQAQGPSPQRRHTP